MCKGTAGDFPLGEGAESSLGAAGAGGRALPLIDDGQRGLLLPSVVQSLESRLELRVPLLVGRDTVHLRDIYGGNSAPVHPQKPSAFAATFRSVPCVLHCITYVHSSRYGQFECMVRSTCCREGDIVTEGRDGSSKERVDWWRGGRLTG